MAAQAYRTLWKLTSFFLLLRYVFAARTNRTIDDENGDSVSGLRPIYSPPTSTPWNYGPSCPGCFVQPNPAYLFDGSWHDITTSTTDPSLYNVTLTFNGTAVWVFCVVPNTVPYATTFVNISFELDGDAVGTYSHVPNTSDEFQYNVTVYSNTSLHQAEHALVMTPQRATNASYLAFDWAMYTFDSDPPVVTSAVSSPIPIPTKSSSSTTSTSSANPSSSPSASSHSVVGPVVGGVVGGIVALILVFVALLFWRRRGRDGAARVRHMKHEEAWSEPIEPVAAEFVPYSDDAAMHQISLPTHPPLPTTASQLPASTMMSTLSLPSGSGSAMPAPSAASGTSLLGISTTAGTEATGRSRSRGRRRGELSKAAMRQEELSRQMHSIEQHVADLRRRQSSAAPSDPTIFAGSSPAVPNTHSDSELRRQIETLQMEVERLRTEAALAYEEPPPAYEEDDDDEEHEEVGADTSIEDEGAIATQQRADYRSSFV